MRAIELFSCSGGMAEGFRRAGIRFAEVFDYDYDACASYTENLGHAPIRLDVRDLVRMVAGGWSPGALDLLVADPPCTPWSRAGKRLGLADQRDMLVDTCDLIRRLRPRAYLIGNVPGLEDGRSWKAVQRHIGGLASAGYCVADFTTLDAADFGVPQHRIRPFWFGHLSGPCITWPRRTHGSPRDLATIALPGCSLLPWATCRDALSHLAPKDLGQPIRLRWRGGERAGKSPRASMPNKPAGVVCSNEYGDGNVLAGPNHRPSRADAPARTLTRNTHSDGALLASSDMFAPSRSDEPAATIRAAARGQQTMVHASSGAHDAIKLSERAAAILQGFPESWVFSGKTKRSRWSQIGMAMPPPLAHAVAESVARQLAAPPRQGQAPPST